jgi:hypothetical protein
MFRRHRDEQGATAVIVALSLVALLGLVVLTVDVGQLLYKRRAMVNASDAAALAAAQTCAGLTDPALPSAMANTYAQDNVSTATGGITEMVGCKQESFGHVSVHYGMNQDLFFAGVLGANGPAQVSTVATAGWGPAGAANPQPIVVYTGQSQGNCDIREGIGAGISCYLWYDNDLFNQSSFGFLNLCTVNDPCQHGWDVDAGANCPNVGASLREDWINGNWTGGPNQVNWPDTTFVCRVSGLSQSDWSSLSDHIGEDLLFPVNDCEHQVDRNGVEIGCNATTAPDKYDIIGFIVLHLDDVLRGKAEWAGNSGTCTTAPMNMTPSSPDIDLDLIASGLGCTPYDSITNVQMNANGNPKCCTLGSQYTYDAVNHVIHWTGGNRNNVRLSWDYTEDGPCGPAPNNSSAECMLVTTVEARFGGSNPGGGADFGVRAVRLCDLAIGSCPEQR